jgi:PAS domain-containing protein
LTPKPDLPTFALKKLSKNCHSHFFSGTLLYYNRRAAKILDRKPEYVETDVHSHHKKAASNRKLDLMLQEFEKGRAEPFRYEARPYGEAIHVTLSPIVRDGEFVGCVQSVLLEEEVLPEE